MRPTRCRHAVAAVGSYVFSYGGLRGSTLLEDFLLSDDNSGAEMTICDPRSDPWCVLPPRSHFSPLAHVTSWAVILGVDCILGTGNLQHCSMRGSADDHDIICD